MHRVFAGLSELANGLQIAVTRETTKRIRALANIPHEELNTHLETYRNHIQREIIRLRTAGETLTQDTINEVSAAYLYPERAQKETERPQDLAGAFDMYLTGYGKVPTP